MFGAPGGEAVRFGAAYYLDRFTVLVLLLGLLFSTDLCGRLRRFAMRDRRVQALAPILESVVLIGLMLVCALTVMTSAYDPFIYFRF